MDKLVAFFALAFYACYNPTVSPDPTPPSPTTYPALHAYECAWAYQDASNALVYGEDVGDCQRQCLAQFQMICASCEGQVQTESWAECRLLVDSPDGNRLINAWLARLASHPEIVATQQVGVDLTVGVGFTYANQIQVIGDCDITAGAAFFNGLPGCADAWHDMVCDTLAGPGVCPVILPPTAAVGAVDRTVAPPEADLRAAAVRAWRGQQPWDLVEGGREEFRRRVFEHAAVTR